MLKKSFREFYDNSPELFRTINTDGIIIDCNKSFAEYLGYSKDELLKRGVFACLKKPVQLSELAEIMTLEEI